MSFACCALRSIPLEVEGYNLPYSHSIVPGGFDASVSDCHNLVY